MPHLGPKSDVKPPVSLALETRVAEDLNRVTKRMRLEEVEAPGSWRRDKENRAGNNAERIFNVKNAAFRLAKRGLQPLPGLARLLENYHRAFLAQAASDKESAGKTARFLVHLNDATFKLAKLSLQSPSIVTEALQHQHNMALLTQADERLESLQKDYNYAAQTLETRIPFYIDKKAVCEVIQGRNLPHLKAACACKP